MVSVLNLLDVKELVRVWKMSKREGMIALTTCLMTLLLAPRIAYALVIGMLFSLVLYLYQTMRPRLSELIYNNQGALVEIVREGALDTCPLVSIVRFHGSLYFANADYFVQKILLLMQQKTKLKYIVLDCFSINRIDATGAETLKRVHKQLKAVGITLILTRVRKPVLRVLLRGNIIAEIGSENFSKDPPGAIKLLAKKLRSRHMKTCPLRHGI